MDANSSRRGGSVFAADLFASDDLLLGPYSSWIYSLRMTLVVPADGCKFVALGKAGIRCESIRFGWSLVGPVFVADLFASDGSLSRPMDANSSRRVRSVFAADLFASDGLWLGRYSSRIYSLRMTLHVPADGCKFVAPDQVGIRCGYSLRMASYVARAVTRCGCYSRWMARVSRPWPVFAVDENSLRMAVGGCWWRWG